MNRDEMMDRTHRRIGESGRAFRRRGAGRTSTFSNVIQQSSAACQALNSPTGQDALALLDAPGHAGKNLRVTLEVGPIREAGFLPATPASRMHTVSRTQVAVHTPVGGATGVRLILDRAAHGTTIHIQTCFPLDTLLMVSKFEIRDMDRRLVIARG